MATKVYDSPTTNIFALLAEEHSEPQARRAKANANKGPEQVLTPKERAEAKAVQDAARKAQREADKAKQEAEAARRKALELVDDTGFAPQRHQRIKETRIQERNAPAPSETPKGKKNWEEGSDKGKGKNWNKNTDGSKGNAGPKTEGTKGGEGKTVLKGDKLAGKQEGKGNPKGEGKSNYKGEGKGNYKGEAKSGYSKAPKREGLDKHSQGVTSRQFQAKKQGHGKANWDETVPAGLNAAPVKEVLANEALAAPGTEAAEAWVDTTTAPATAEGESTDPTTAETDKRKEEEDEDENNKTLEEYLAEQAEKKKALEAVVGSTLQARQLTDEEKKAVSKFTLVANTKAPAKKETKTTKPTTAAAPAVAGARKGEKPVSEDLLSFRVAGARSGGRGGPRGPRGEGQQRDNTAGRGQGQGQQRKGGRGPQKIGKGKNEFPDLGPK